MWGVHFTDRVWSCSGKLSHGTTYVLSIIILKWAEAPRAGIVIHTAFVYADKPLIRRNVLRGSQSVKYLADALRTRLIDVIRVVLSINREINLIAKLNKFVATDELIVEDKFLSRASLKFHPSKIHVFLRKVINVKSNK